MKRTTLATLIAATALVVAVPFAAQAERGHDRRGGPDGEHMKAMDTNGDGDISKEEVQAFRATMFNAADANQDGALTLDEMIAHHETMEAQRKAERQASMFAKLDADGNGTVSAAEFAARPSMKDHRGKSDRRGDRRGPGAPDTPDDE